MLIAPLPRPAARPGFTVIEIIAALGVLAVAITGAAFVMTSAFGTYRHQDRMLNRNNLLKQEMEVLTATPYASLQQTIKTARKPADPVSPDRTGRNDFQSVDSGQAIANFYWQNHPENETWESKPMPQAPPGAVISRVSAPRHALEATVKLQYWDPEFDAPSLTDKGLVRATYDLSGDGVEQHQVKYLSR